MKQIPAGERASFRTAKSEMYVGDITPTALFGSYYYIWQGANRADDAGGILTGVMRCVVYRHSENPSSRFESSISTTSVDPGGYAFILFRNERDLVNTVMARHGFELIWQTHCFGLYHKAKSIPAVHSVRAVDWIRGSYYIVGLKTNYNYLFLWQDPARIDPAIAQ
jgi:hypothetical protein